MTAHLAKRKFDVAEYFFEEDASKYLDLAKEAADHVYGVDNPDVVIAFEKYLNGDSYRMSTGICGSTTAGFGFLDGNGYFEFQLPSDFTKQFLI